MFTGEPFTSSAKKEELRLGWIYLPVHFVLLPLLLGWAANRWQELSISTSNIIYYTLGLVFVGVCMLRWLRRDFDRYLDRPLHSIRAVTGGYLIDLGVSFAVALLIMGLELELTSNPNDTAILTLKGQDWKTMKAMALFIAPMLEEILMRGVVFGSLYPRSRRMAYLVSVLLFAVCHVWQYALAYQDYTLWIYVLQYIAPALGLCWCYEKSGSLWAPITLHMILNAVGYAFMA